MSEGESLVHEKAEALQTSEKSILQYKNTKADPSIRKGNASSNSRAKHSMQGDGKATALPNGKASLTTPTFENTSENKGNKSSNINKNDTNSVKKTQSNSQSTGKGKWGKYNMLIVGDSMLSHTNGRILSKKCTTRFAASQVLQSEMFDYFKP